MDALSAASAAGNLITSVALAAAGIAAMALAGLPRGRRVLPPALALVTGASLCFLAADEGFELHDRVGRWLYYERSIEAPGPVNHVDDLFVLGYAALGAAVAMVALPHLLRAPRFFAAMAAVGTMMLGAVALDALGRPGSWTDAPEEALEAGGAVLAAAAFGMEALRGRQLPRLPLAARGERLAAR
jgi:hypothetical protein